MHLGLKLPLVDNSSQTGLGLLCFLLTLPSIMAKECSFAEVVASNPCPGSGAGITAEDCRQRSDECCVLEKINGDTKCLRTKQKQPSADGCRDAPILRSKPMLNQFLQGDVTLEVKVVSELQCWDHCIRQEDCKAYNYYHAIGQSFKTCQLLSNDVGLPIFHKGCTYHVMSRKEKNIKTLLRNKCP